jgi:membrane protease YdiL (CAAX protease family)
MTEPLADTHLVRSTLLVYASIMVVWTLAWLLKVRFIDAQFRWFTTGLGSFLWWTSVKTIVWIAPASWLIRRSGRTPQNVAGFANWKRAVRWGGSLGLVAAATSLVPAMSGGQSLLPAAFSPALLNTLLIAPVYEEFLARGALMGNLQQRWPSWIANVMAALMFVGMHIPGWYFMGTLPEKLAQPFGGAVSIFVLGLAFGYAVQRSGSLLGGVIAHFLNNLAAGVQAAV